MTTADVVIIGGGCMGASVAYHLARAGITRVVLLERETALGTGSTGRNAGGVRHQFSHEANVRLSIESIRAFERFGDDVGAVIDFHQDGYLFLLASEADVAVFREAVALQRRLGVDVEWLDADEAARRAPGLRTGGIRAATFCARDGISDPNGVTMGYAAAARRAGVAIRRDTEVTGIRSNGGRVVAVETRGEVIHAGAVVNATGPWAGRVGAMAGVPTPIEPLRRHIFIAAPPPAGWATGGPGGTPAAPDSRVMVIDMASTFYFHREGAGLLFGMADPDEARGFDLTVNWSVLEKIAPVAARRLPALEEADITHAWAGLYEMTADAMPIIGATDRLAGWFTIAGFSGHGFQHAPAAGRILADLIAGRDPGLDLAPFAHGRFDRSRTGGEHHVV
ncbi:MAG: FAD-binding oxidoreductase [Vicinamibacterales bacterium]